MRTNEQTELHQFRKQRSYDGDLSPCQVWIGVEKAFFELQSRNVNVDGQTNGQTNKQNYFNFESSLAMMVIYLPVKFKFN